MTDFNCFPVELHHQILSFADPVDILALRKTSKYFFALTREPRLWTAVYYRMRQTHTLSCSQSEFTALAPWQCERLLVRASKTEKVFQTSRERAQHHILPSGQTCRGGPLVALSFLSERFLLSADDTTTVYIWDMSRPTFPCARLTLVGWAFLTHSMSDDHSTLHVVLSNADRAHIFRLSLPVDTYGSDTDDSKLSFRDIAYIDTHFNDVNSIDVDSCLVLLQPWSTFFEIVDWRSKNRMRVSLLQATAEVQSHNCVLALRICGPYVLCFRQRSIDAYPVPHRFSTQQLATQQPLSVLRHTDMMFSARTCFSRVRSARSSSCEVYTVCALAGGEHQGTLCYQIDVQTTPVPALSVRLLCADGVRAGGRVSAWDLGTSGRRGVWVLRLDRSSERHIVALTTSSPRDQDLFEPFPFTSPFSVPEGSGTVGMHPGMVPRFEKTVVWTMSSIYSSDEVTRCAVSEFTGRIALGSQAGAITVL